MRSIVVLCVATLLLAGCSGEEPAPEEQDEGDFDDFDLEDAKEELGVIRGVVVDAGIQPIADAVVSLLDTPHNVTTKESGTFAFKDVEPGIHFIEVKRFGYKVAQTSTEVEAGRKDPPVVRVRLDREPGSEPAIVPGHFQGIITCSIRIPAAGFNDGCGVFGNLGLGSTQREDFGFTSGNIWWIQTELSWVPSSLTSERLCIDQGENLHEEVVCAESPIVQGMNQTTVGRRGLDEGETFQAVVYPDHLLADVSGNIVVDQEFEIFAHAFYNFLPPEGWEFGRDGLPPVPV